ncbi:hypothetical protein FE257_003503 [Aspergillus nanangensis]|uniref:Xylanolytic transcriptional activator regulatory domain-containing protein n=1 Tax=Aspergillus nanangensis TaxID=2582783 RepID=A0AAD4GNH3_ASPNN|nr:hypothetical protein FE257_003503 [Aspergillus nanangensis]
MNPNDRRGSHEEGSRPVTGVGNGSKRLLPACTGCIEAGTTCQPRQVPLGSTADEASGLSNATVPDYVETLKRKADDLNQRFRRQRARVGRQENVQSSNTPNPGTESPPYSSSETTSNQTPITGQDGLGERSVQAAMGEIGYLSRNAMAEPRDEGRGFPQELSMGNMVKAALAISGEDPSLSSQMCVNKHALVSMMGETPNLNREFASAYLDRFLQHAIVYCPHIDEAEIGGHFHAYFDRAEESPIRAFNVHMVVAVGMLLSAEAGVELLASNLHNIALKKFPFILECSNGVNILHCMILLIVYSMLSYSGGSTWHLVGLAMDKAISYRFHKEPQLNSGFSVESLSSRRNVFWSLYILDRTISCTMGRPFSIQDDDISLQYSISDPTSNMPLGHELRDHIIMHARLMSNIRSKPLQRPVFHYGNLCYWREIPKGIKDSVFTNPILSNTIRQLTCRALVHIVQIGGCTRPPSSIVNSAQNIPQDKFSGDFMGPVEPRPPRLIGRSAPTNSNPTVYVLDTFPPQAIEHAKTLFNIIQPHDPEFQNWRQNARALLIRGSYVTAADIASCPNLVAIGKHGVGIDKIDQAACSQRNIKIINTPGANSRDVAELVVTLALSVARGIRSITTRQMAKPVPKETCNGMTLYQRTIGIIGMGNIGRTVAEIFRGGFDAQVIAYDAYMPDEIWAHIPHTRAKSIDEVIAQADVLSLHVPLTDETRDMITYDRIRAMKPDAILINAARGGIVNEDDLATALSEGYLWGAGLDCHEQEPPSRDRYGALWENLNVVSTPHIGAATPTAQLACATAAVDNLHRYLSNL